MCKASLIRLWTPWLKTMQLYKEALSWGRDVMKCMYIMSLGRDMIACMQYALPYEWNNWTIQSCIFWATNYFLLKHMLCRTMRAGFNFIKDVLRSFTYCISARILRFISGFVLSSRQFFRRSEVSPLKANAMQKNENYAYY